MDEMQEQSTPAEADVGLPSLPSRLIGVFVSPGDLMSKLAREPKWAGALLVSILVSAIAVSLIPVDLFIEMNRQAAIERGGEFPEMGERGRNFMRLVIPLGAIVGTLFITVIMTGVYTVIFSFVLGDEGRFVQYLAVVTHALFIPALFGLLVTPLRISTGDPQFTLNLASFFSFLPDGYLHNVLRVCDLTQIWSTLVIAQGAHAIDRRRSFGSAAAILLVIFLLLALVIARFMP